MAKLKKEDGCYCENNYRMWIPQNSKIQVNEDNSIKIVPPSGFIYVGFDENGILRQSYGDNGTKVSCNCLVKGKCLPFVGTGPGGSTAGCAGDCTSCDMTQSVIDSSGQEIVIYTGGYIDLTQNISFIQEGQELPSAYKAMFELEFVQKEIISFLKTVYQGLSQPTLREGDNFISTPNGYSMGMINVFGRATAIPIPTISMQAANGVGGGTARCECASGGSCKIVKTGIKGISLTYCEGDCSGTCTLYTSINEGNGNVEKTSTSEFYRF